MKRFWFYEGFGIRKDGDEISDYGIICVSSTVFSWREDAVKELGEIIDSLGLKHDRQMVKNEDFPAIKAALLARGWCERYIPIGP